METDKILAEIRKGRVAPCYLLCGEDEYLLRDVLDKIIESIIPASDRDMNLFVLDGDAEDIDRLCESLLTSPLIPGRKLIVVRNTRIFHSRKTLPAVIQKIRDRVKTNPALAAADFMLFLRMTGWTLDDLKDGGWQKISDEQWRQVVQEDDGQDRETWLPVMAAFCAMHRLEAAPSDEGADRLEAVLRSGLPEGNHLILTTEAVDKRKKLYKTIHEVGNVLEFTSVKGDAKLKGRLMENARELLAAKGKKMAPGAWLVLGKKTGFDLRTSMAALEKLITFTGENPSIEEADIQAAIGKTTEESVFNLTAALAEKNLPAGLVILGDLLNQGDPPLKILAMLAREIRTLLQAKLLLETGSRIAFKAGLDYGAFQKNIFPKVKERLGAATPHPYVIYQTLGRAGRFSRKSLIQHLATLADMDLALKSTAKDARLMLERFMIQVCE
ncbi:MAG: DNA polymerase III subunit delta [Syntrophus sp. (in: bacteria)]|nr:DNA polymerase III subunit delta [Syntrophus sp. (in: bacteria)]